MSASRAVQPKVTGVCFWNWVLFFVTSFISNAIHFKCGHVWTRCWEPVCVMLAQFSMHCCFFTDGLMLSFLCSFVSLSLGLSACNSSGHLSNHAEIAPSYAGITFAISNTLVSCLPVSVCLAVCVSVHFSIVFFFFLIIFFYSVYMQTNISIQSHNHTIYFNDKSRGNTVVEEIIWRREREVPTHTDRETQAGRKLFSDAQSTMMVISGQETETDWQSSGAVWKKRWTSWAPCH